MIASSTVLDPYRLVSRRVASNVIADIGAADWNEALAQASAYALTERSANQQSTIEAWAAARFVGSASGNELASLFDPGTGLDERRVRVLADASVETLLADLARTRARHADAAVLASTAESETLHRYDLASRARDEVSLQQRHRASRASSVQENRSDLEASRVLATVAGADFPLVALDAYWRGAEAVQDERGCRLEWWALAGISRVEGQHGTFGGSTLTARGSTTHRIIGIPLDGENETAVIADSDGGRLDGDPVFDRAVGPMQFIPQTWYRSATDGNGDGRADPHSLYDAAATAGRYLCAAGLGLDADGPLRTAYFSYNHSEEYVETVLGFAHRYRAAIAIP